MDLQKSTIWILLLFQCSCGMMLRPGGDYGQENGCHFRVVRGFVVKWDELPVPLYVHGSVPSDVHKNFSYAVDIWNESWNHHTNGQGRLFDLVGKLPPGSPSPNEQEAAEDKINTLFLDTDLELLLPDLQGSTFVRSGGWAGTIYDADITINGIDYDYYYEGEKFDYSVYTKVPELSTKRALASTTSESFWSRLLSVFQTFWNFLVRKPTRTISAKKLTISKDRVDAISLYLHELGHLGGLTHMEYSKKDIMYPKLSLGQVRRDIGKRELDNFGCVYR